MPAFKPSKWRKESLIAIGLALCVLIGLVVFAQSANTPTKQSVEFEGSDTSNRGVEEFNLQNDNQRSALPDSSSPELTVEESALQERQVVTTGNAKIRTKNPSQAAKDFSEWVLSNDGFVTQIDDTIREDRVESTDPNYTPAKESATVTAKVIDIKDAVQFLESMDNSELLSQSLNRNDVTEQVADISARIDALETSIERLNVFLREADDYNDLFQVERELTTRQGELDSLRAQQKTLEEQVAFNTITVTFAVSDSALSPTEKTGKSFQDGILRGWNNLVSFVESIVFGIAAFIPWLIILGPLGIVGVALLRRKRKRNVFKANEGVAQHE